MCNGDETAPMVARPPPFRFVEEVDSCTTDRDKPTSARVVRGPSRERATRISK